MTPFKLLLRFLVFLLVLGAFSEGWLRTVMPASEYPYSAQDTVMAIDRYDSNGLTEGLYTYGRDTRRGGEWRVNNMGWISAIDYKPPAVRSKPLIAILGDSYIEGFLSDVDQHIDTFLPAVLGNQYDVYSFGKSGLYLEQYVAMARYIRTQLEPSMLVILVNKDDITSSLRENGVVSPYRFQIERSATGFVEVPALRRNEPSWRKAVKRAVSFSALLRYLLFNAQLATLWGTGSGIADANLQDDQPRGIEAGGSEKQASDMATQDLASAAAFMVGRLRADHPGIPLVFVGDGPRYLTVDEIDNVTMDPDVAAVLKASEAFPQCYSLDHRRVFAADSEVSHERFEGVDGHHWSAYGNQVVAQALGLFLIAEGLVD